MLCQAANLRPLGRWTMLVSGPIAPYWSHPMADTRCSETSEGFQWRGQVPLRRPLSDTWDPLCLRVWDIKASSWKHRVLSQDTMIGRRSQMAM